MSKYENEKTVGVTVLCVTEINFRKMSLSQKHNYSVVFVTEWEDERE